MSQLNITKHPIDRTSLIAGIMFTFAGLAYLVDDHGILNVSEGAVAGTVVIVIGLVMLLAALLDNPASAASAGVALDDSGVQLGQEPDFSWATQTATTATTTTMPATETARSAADEAGFAATTEAAVDEAE